MFAEIKAAAQLAARGRVLVYAHDSATTRGSGWLQNPTPEQIEKLTASLKGDVRMEEMYIGKDIV